MPMMIGTPKRELLVAETTKMGVHRLWKQLHRSKRGGTIVIRTGAFAMDITVIQFSTKENYKRVVVTNLATETIMWSLKAELKGSFDATPAYGLLRTSEQQIAIDYAFVHPFTPKFDKNVFRPLEKRRHILQAIIC
ncbi:hypothetical protein COOONC_17375 [Cooperia oncophora]